MSWTKRQLVEQAHAEIGLSSYSYSLQPQQLQDAMIKMDSMLAMWRTKGIYIGYTSPEDQLGGDLDDDSEIELEANEAVYLNLAIRLAPSFGKFVAHETRINAKSAYLSLLNRATIAPELKHADGSLSGAGNRNGSRYQTFLPNEEYTNVKTIRDELDLD